MVAVYNFVTVKEEPKDPNEYGDQRSPWLELSFQQSKRYVKLDRVDIHKTYKDGPHYLIGVNLSSDPFRILIPQKSDGDALMITPWVDNTIFNQIKRGMKVFEVPYLCKGCGLAKARYGPFELTVSKEAVNYFIDTRLGTVDGTHNISISGFAARAQDAEPVTIGDNLYMVAFMDINNDGIVNHAEYEFYKITLD